MEFYHFSEQPYTPAWQLGLESLRNNIPNRYCDPKVASDIYAERLDEYALCDELGINVMLNEHHTTATCMSVSCTLHLAILARITSKVRLLACGLPIANRPDPLRVAEELAMIDVISRGRLEIGLIKGAPYEIAPANSNPSRMMERFWESHDLIIKLLSSRDGPINWEGEFFHYRQANIWPQPWQQPHPPIWITAQSPQTTREVALRGHRLAVFLCGWELKKLYDLYRSVTAELGRPTPAPERFAYMALIAVGDTEAEAARRAYDLQGYWRTSKIVAEAYLNPPGYLSAQANAQWLLTRGRVSVPATTRDGRAVDLSAGPIADLTASAARFAGTPDQVYAQICALADHVGGIGHLLLMFHGGDMSHADTTASLRLFAREVMPRLQQRYPADMRGLERQVA